jgi:hypothetical protein
MSDPSRIRKALRESIVMHIVEAAGCEASNKTQRGDVLFNVAMSLAEFGESAGLFCDRETSQWVQWACSKATLGEIGSIVLEFKDK